MKIYNTLTRKVEEFVPLNKGKINMFVCGPTVYDYPHLGHAKTYTQFDFIVKYLRYRGLDVNYLQNITNLDDKILKRSQEQGKSWDKLAKEFEDIYYEDMQALHINSVTKFARATDYIPQIVNQVKVLMDKGFAYKTTDGIYFDISKFADYGKLAKRTEADQNAGVSRIDEGLDKRNKNDFCLWKFSPFWKTEIGGGRPGWHIEDTAITETVFGPQYDIHGGSMDLIFPHHEAEIAQMESASGKKPLVRYWMHTGFLNINSEKMSKSKGNFLTIRDVLKEYDYRTLRLFFLSFHYRTAIDFTHNALEQARGALERLDQFVSHIDKNLEDNIGDLEEKVLEHLDNDFDTPKTMAVIFDFVRNNQGKAGKNAFNFFQELNQSFDFLEFNKEIPAEIKELMAKREQLRSEKKFSEADKLRIEIEKHGYSVEDKKL